MSDAVREHREDAPTRIRCGVITVSDTRTLETDRGGAAIIERLEQNDHEVASRVILPDDPEQLAPQLTEYCGRDDIDAILMTGGTGVSSRDQTLQTVTGFIDKPLPGYGELFRMLSFEEIGAAAMLSRATGGIARGKVLLTMPGSTAGVILAMDRLILPELAHLVREARR